jgi:predicted nuclease of predicted toxin-antitoxin system
MKNLIDMNLTPRWVEHLRLAGYEVIHWSSIGNMSAPDQEICDHDRLHELVLLTNYLDFPRILAHTKHRVVPIGALASFQVQPTAEEPVPVASSRDLSHSDDRGPNPPSTRHSVVEAKKRR